MSGPEKFTPRRATVADAETLVGLFNRAFGKTKDSRTMSWKYFGAPHGDSLTFLAEGVGDGEVEARAGGAYSYVSRRMTIAGRPFVGTQASDAMVDVPFRKRGIFTSLDDRCAEAAGAEGAPVCFAVAGRQSMHGFLKNGWRDIGTWQTWIGVLDPAALLGAKLPRALARLGGVAVSLGLALTGRRPRSGVAPGFGPIERFDSRADALFDDVKEDLPIAGVRDAAWLNWRFVDTPTGRHRCFALHRDGREGRLDGWIVVEDALGRGWVVEILGRDADAEDLLLRGAFAHLRERGNPMVFLSTIPCARVESMLRRNGMFPHPRKKPFKNATPTIIRVLREDLDPSPSTLLDPTQWYLFDGDRDVEHMSPALPED